MTKAVDMKDTDWLKLYVNSEVDKFSKKFGIQFDSQEIEDVCKNVADMKLPEGLDVFYAVMILTNTDDYVLDNYVKLAQMYNLTLGIDMLVFVYGKFVEAEGYDEQVAFIFKNCIQYTIPF